MRYIATVNVWSRDENVTVSVEADNIDAAKVKVRSMRHEFNYGNADIIKIYAPIDQEKAA